jgi:hypothetical protein
MHFYTSGTAISIVSETQVNITFGPFLSSTAQFSITADTQIIVAIIWMEWPGFPPGRGSPSILTREHFLKQEHDGGYEALIIAAGAILFAGNLFSLSQTYVSCYQTLDALRKAVGHGTRRVCGSAKI